MRLHGSVVDGLQVVPTDDKPVSGVTLRSRKDNANSDHGLA